MTECFWAKMQHPVDLCCLCPRRREEAVGKELRRRTNCVTSAVVEKLSCLRSTVSRHFRLSQLLRDSDVHYLTRCLSSCHIIFISGSVHICVVSYQGCVVRWLMLVLKNVKSWDSQHVRLFSGYHCCLPATFLQVLISPLGFSLGPPASSHSPTSDICAIGELVCLYMSLDVSPTYHQRQLGKAAAQSVRQTSFTTSFQVWFKLGGEI